MERLRGAELKDEGNAVCSPATLADTKLSVEEQRPLLWRAENLPLASVSFVFRKLNVDVQSS